MPASGTLQQMAGTPHRRFNPLRREWVLVSPHRTQRPWQGQVEKTAEESQPQFDPSCYLCPGNPRAGGMKNPDYQTTFVFDNDFAALLPNAPDVKFNEGGILRAETETGICRVVCFLPRHDLTVARMSVDEIQTVIKVWTEQYKELGSRPGIRYVQIFENRGAMMGASNPHPHCQIWANATVPNEPALEQEAFERHEQDRGECLLCAYAQAEAKAQERVVCENEAFLAVVPFWAVWPFETLVVSKRHFASFDQLQGDESRLLADLMKRLTTRYDNVFQISFPYSMGFHQRPTDEKEHPEWHFHAHYYPPLLRSATVRKFMVGYEMLGGPQRDITPETAAARLREMPEKHYAE